MSAFNKFRLNQENRYKGLELMNGIYQVFKFLIQFQNL